MALVPGLVCKVLVFHVILHQLSLGGALSRDGTNLLLFKQGITVDQHNVLLNWNESDAHPCGWSGVTCNNISLRVVSLRIVGCRCLARGSARSITDNWSHGNSEGLPEVCCVGDACSSSHEPEYESAGEISCGLTGRLSPAVGKLSELRTLTMPCNRLSGKIPRSISRLRFLQVLDLHSNRFTGKVPSEFGKLSNLQMLNLNNNVLKGRIPAQLSLCLGLQQLNLAKNELSGSIPPSLGGLSKLERLVLSFNRLTGSIPPELASSCPMLQILQLTGNSIVGTIPPQLGNCAQLQQLLLSSNSISGTIPVALGHLSNLKTLQFAGNNLIGQIPHHLGQLQALSSLMLSSNLLTGYIPSELGNLTGLRVLDLSGNSISGSIPVELYKLSMLEDLLLNNNSLVGRIPGSLEQLVSLRFADFSHNNLSGSVPLSGNAKLLCSRLKFAGNLFLEACEEARGAARWLSDQTHAASSLDSPFASSPTDQPYDDPSHRLSSILVAAITSGCAIGVVLFILGLLFQCTRQRNSSAPIRESGRKEVVFFMNMNHHLTYENVVRATGNFSVDNLIGNGGFGATYKAELKPGLLVAVKRLAIGRFQGVQQFDTEIRTLGRIRHANLVTLLGYHASQNEMFLIYNYFPQGNLETLIHTNSKGEMDWVTRHNIALRIAQALSFLHDECVPRVLHRDIKPSNILLDDNLNAHLSDFGLARLLGASETHATTDVAGTFGYVAPEYAMTCRVTDKADVYSYGVVLLELLSGKRALDPSFSDFGDGFNIVSWACLLIRQGQAHEVFTVQLWEQGPESSLLEALKLAVLCTVESLSIRPPMKEVVERLRVIQPPSPSS